MTQRKPPEERHPRSGSENRARGYQVAVRERLRAATRAQRAPTWCVLATCRAAAQNSPRGAEAMADREMPLKADTEKPHRCPACWQIPPQFYGGIMRLWRTYTCPDGHRFAKWRRPVWFLTWPLRRKIRSLGWRLEDWRWERRNG